MLTGCPSQYAQAKAVRFAQDVEFVLLRPVPQALIAAPRTVEGLIQLVPANDAFRQEDELLPDARAIRGAVRPPA